MLEAMPHNCPTGPHQLHDPLTCLNSGKIFKKVKIMGFISESTA